MKVCLSVCLSTIVYLHWVVGIEYWSMHNSVMSVCLISPSSSKGMMMMMKSRMRIWMITMILTGNNDDDNNADYRTFAEPFQYWYLILYEYSDIFLIINLTLFLCYLGRPGGYADVQAMGGSIASNLQSWRLAQLQSVTTPHSCPRQNA